MKKLGGRGSSGIQHSPPPPSPSLSKHVWSMLCGAGWRWKCLVWPVFWALITKYTDIACCKHFQRLKKKKKEKEPFSAVTLWNRLLLKHWKYFALVTSGDLGCSYFPYIIHFAELRNWQETSPQTADNFFAHHAPQVFAEIRGLIFPKILKIVGNWHPYTLRLLWLVFLDWFNSFWTTALWQLCTTL